jgi:organic hydroperoxide reductase OsmC/OhrA
MPPKPHSYRFDLSWTGAANGPATDIKTFNRAFELRYSNGKVIAGSSDPNFMGDANRMNPEELLVGAVASCHLLTWLYLAARNGLGVVAYEDSPEGTLSWVGDTYAMTALVLRPRVTLVPGADAAKADALHHEAHKQCFVARSVNFPVTIEVSFS